MSEKVRQFLEQAREAERMARTATDPDERAAFERIAAIWRDLAATREHLKEQQD